MPIKWTLRYPSCNFNNNQLTAYLVSSITPCCTVLGYFNCIPGITLFPFLDVEMEIEEVQKGHQWSGAETSTHSGMSLSGWPPCRETTSYLYTQSPTQTHLRMNCWPQARAPLPPLICPTFPSHFLLTIENPHILMKGQLRAWCERINFQLPLSLFLIPQLTC